MCITLWEWILSTAWIALVKINCPNVGCVFRIVFDYMRFPPAYFKKKLIPLSRNIGSSHIFIGPWSILPLNCRSLSHTAHSERFLPPIRAIFNMIGDEIINWRFSLWCSIDEFKRALRAMFIHSRWFHKLQSNKQYYLNYLINHRKFSIFTFLSLAFFFKRHAPHDLHTCPLVLLTKTHSKWKKK